MQQLTSTLWNDLNRINREVNKAVVSDYASIKIRRLSTETAWRRSNLSTRACYGVHGQGRAGRDKKHTVAIATTNRGTYILDNYHQNAIPYGEFPYKWV